MRGRIHTHTHTHEMSCRVKVKNTTGGGRREKGIGGGGGTHVIFAPGVDAPLCPPLVMLLALGHITRTLLGQEFSMLLCCGPISFPLYFHFCNEAGRQLPYGRRGRANAVKCEATEV